MSIRRNVRTIGIAAMLAVAVLSSPAFQGGALAASEREPDVPGTTIPKPHQSSASQGAAERQPTQPTTTGSFIINPNTEIWD